MHQTFKLIADFGEIPARNVTVIVSYPIHEKNFQMAKWGRSWHPC